MRTVDLAVSAVVTLALPLIAGCGPPTKTFDPQKYWLVPIRGDLEGFYREFPEAAPDDALVR